MKDRKLSLDELNRISPEFFSTAKKIPVVLILDNIRSQMNIGSLFRTADAFRVKRICLCGITAKPPHREINKTALGATETVEWAYFSDTREAVELLRSENHRIIAVEQTQQSRSVLDQPLSDIGPVAFVFGNEVNGIDEGVLTLCDASVEIPQYGTKHSLNISVCAGIVIWEAFKAYRQHI